jgi:chromosome segregation and condensation protein ScpB
VGVVNERSALEAILFVTEHPVPLRELAEVLEVPVSRVTELLKRSVPGPFSTS